MTFGDYQFTCAICREDVHDWSGRNGRDRHLAPLCRRCETVTSYSWSGQARCGNRIGHGAFMDRRKASQIAALADRLHAEAMQHQWRRQHARS